MIFQLRFLLCKFEFASSDRSAAVADFGTSKRKQSENRIDSAFKYLLWKLKAFSN